MKTVTINDDEPELPLQLLNAGHITMNGDWNFGPICSPFLRIYWVEDGHASIELKDGQHPLTPGHLYLVPTYMRHTDRNEGLFTHTYIHVLNRSYNSLFIQEHWSIPFEIEAGDTEIQLVKRVLALAPDTQLPQTNPGTYDTQMGVQRAQEVFNRMPHPLRYEICAVLMQLLARFYNHPSAVSSAQLDERVRRAQRQILQNLSQTPSLDTLASEAALCKDAFIRLFKREVGQTPTEYIIQKRVERAQLLLLTERSSIKEVSVRTGFGTQAYFAEQFKRATGLSPLAYRRMNRK